MQVSPAQLVTLLTAAIPARLPILITGAPGVGKTDIVSQVTASLGWNFIVSHPVTADPTDAKGMPWVYQTADGPRAAFIPFAELELVYAATTPTVWFIDDLGQSNPSTQASYMAKLHPPTFNGKRIEVNGKSVPECVTILAATNGRADRAGVSGILEPVKSRFVTIVELVPEIDSWCQWAINDGNIPVTLIAFHRYRCGEGDGGLLSKFTPTADMSNSPMPRTWENLAKLEALHFPSVIEALAFAGAVGEAAANEYIAFRRMFASLTSIDAILLDPKGCKLPTAPNELYATCTALASKATDKNLSSIGVIATRLMDAGRGEFAALLMKDVLRRNPKLQYTDTFIRISCSPVGQLLSGMENN